jgi:hypothetical protein
MIALIENVLEDNRQVEIEVDRNDVIAMDCTMSILLLPMMRKFKENNMGYPYNGEDENDPDGEEGEAKWLATIDEIIWAMEVTANGEHYNWFGEQIHLHHRRQAAFELFGKNFGNFWI